MNSEKITGLERERITFINERIWELTEIINHNKAELSAAESERQALKSELKELEKTLQQEDEN